MNSITKRVVLYLEAILVTYIKTYISIFFLISMDNQVFMQDLESGLHLMLRGDVARSKLLKGEKLNALKDWLHVLTKVGALVLSKK